MIEKRKDHESTYVVAERYMMRRWIDGTVEILSILRER